MADATEPEKAAALDEAVRERVPQGLSRLLFLLLTLAAILIAIHQLYNLQVFGIVLIEGRYLYLLAGCFLSLTFLGFKGFGREGEGVPWWDYLLAAAALFDAGAQAREDFENDWDPATTI